MTQTGAVSYICVCAFVRQQLLLFFPAQVGQDVWQRQLVVDVVLIFVGAIAAALLQAVVCGVCGAMQRGIGVRIYIDAQIDISHRTFEVHVIIIIISVLLRHCNYRVPFNPFYVIEILKSLLAASWKLIIQVPTQ
jgi:hypothetical protein